MARSNNKDRRCVIQSVSGQSRKQAEVNLGRGPTRTRKGSSLMPLLATQERRAAAAVSWWGGAGSPHGTHPLPRAAPRHKQAARQLPGHGAEAQEHDRRPGAEQRQVGALGGCTGGATRPPAVLAEEAAAGGGLGQELACQGEGIAQAGQQPQRHLAACARAHAGVQRPIGRRSQRVQAAAVACGGSDERMQSHGWICVGELA